MALKQTSGLIHPRSLDRWLEWQADRHRVRRLRNAVAGAVSARRGRTPQETPLVLHSREDGGRGRVLLGVDSASPTSRASLLTALPYLSVGVDVLAPADIRLPELAGPDWDRRELTAGLDELGGREIRAVLTLGQHLRVGRAVHEWAHEHDVAGAVVQHGVLTPYAPPLPPATTLLAWSEADAEYLRSGRDDIAVRVVGSQLLWQAGHEGAAPAPVRDRPADETAEAAEDAETAADTESPPRERPVFLGQMHGAELSRRITSRTAYTFCRVEGALYRPHPAETDALSRAAHSLMRRRGIELQDPSVPLAQAGGPVVGMFSTGVLEAAMRGIPSYVTAAHVPGWLRELWDRYDMRRWGFTDPTPAPQVPADEPSRVIAQVLEGSGG